MLCDRPHVQISQILSLCYAILTSLLLSQDSGLDCFLLILLPATGRKEGKREGGRGEGGKKGRKERRKNAEVYTSHWLVRANTGGSTL
jgi:hypothetical protein